MASSENTIQKISWPEVFPWLMLFRSIPVAASISVMVLALIGTVATPAGWLLSEVLFVRHQMKIDDAEFAATVAMNRSPYLAVFDASGKRGNNIELFGAKLSGPRAVFTRLSDPFQQLFRPNMGPSRWAYYLVGCVWTLAVWALIGCGITRICLLRLTRDESAGLDDAFDFALPRFTHCLGAIGLPLLGVFVLVIPALFVGLLMSFDLGLLVGSILWGLVLICGLLMTLLLMGMFFSWPLVISSISAESQSPLDAITRCFSYVFQRPFHYLFYVLVSVVLGGVCWLIVAQVASGTVVMAQWAGSWGSNIASGDRMARITGLNNLPETATPATLATGEAANQTPASSESGMLVAGRSIISFWNGFVSTIAVAFLYGLFWCMAACVYLLLRKDVDEVELDEIFIDEESRAFDIPPLKTDSNGIPQIQPLDSQTVSESDVTRI